MKKTRYIMSLLCVLLCANSGKAYQRDFSSENFVSEAKESYVQYAAVNFIVKRSTVTNDANGNDLDNSPIKEGKGCPSGESLVDGQCINVSACNNSFPLTSADSKIGSYVTKNCGSGNRYCYTSCATGWKKNGCSCEAGDCSSFPFSESKGHNCNGTASCKTGNNYRYKCTNCTTGYNLTAGGTCTDKACSEYGSGYFGEPTAHCKASDVKRNGEKHCYKCTACEDGWDLSNGVCSETKCSYTKSQVSHCSSYNTIYKSGDGMCYRCSACEDGYTLNGTGTACTAKTCTNGYAAGSTNLSRCTSASSYKGGENYCHLCNSCVNDYYKSNGGCKACTWSDHTLDSCPGGCNCSNYRNDNACRYKYKITSAQSEHYVSGNTCPACTWSDYTLSSCPSGCNCSNYRQADTCSYKYKVTSAQSEHYVSGNTCPACTWGGRTLGSCPSGCNCSSESCGGTTKYSVSSAQSNHYQSGNTCPACTWGGYTLSSCPSGCNCSNYRQADTCSYKYKVTSAQSNHYVSGNTCPACTWNGYTLSSCPSDWNCTSDTCGGTTKYAKTTPKCTWSGYTLASCPNGCNCASDTCGGTTKYSVSSAKSGYYQSGNSCPMNSCDGYNSNSSSISNCSATESCQKGSDTVFKCTMCQNNYALDETGYCESTKCEIGRIYYTDNTCSENLKSNKTVVGIVANNDASLIVRHQTDPCGKGVQPDRAYDTAVSICEEITIDGRNFHLTSKDEMLVLYENGNLINTGLNKLGETCDGINRGFYWTTTYAYNGSDKICVHGTSGTVTLCPIKNQKQRYRCVYSK